MQNTGKARETTSQRAWYSPGLRIGKPIMGYCGVVEVRSLEDALGATCARSATAECSDCGVLLCSAHAEQCASCDETFCPPCHSFHQDEGTKPVSAERPATEKRKSA
jgi:hypothetical protein